MNDGAHDDTSIARLFSRLIDDAEHFVRAEIGLYRAQIFARLEAARGAIALAVVAFLIAQSAIVALLVGLVLVVRRGVHSSAWATVIVVGGSLVLATVLVGIAYARIKRATRIGDSGE